MGALGLYVAEDFDAGVFMMGATIVLGLTIPLWWMFLGKEEGRKKERSEGIY
jgi:hypothetical protein